MTDIPSQSKSLNGASWTVGIDVGGTFTDFFGIDAAGRALVTKTPTTHYDLSVGFMRGMRQLARAAGLELSALLQDAGSLRYSTTVGTNALIERTGPKLGLITTAGFEDTIYLGRSRSWADGLGWMEGRDLARINKPVPLIARNMVVGLNERIDCAGQIIAPLDPDELKEKLQLLVDRGAQGFVVALLWSFANPVHERRVRELIEAEYPEDYLGSMPVILSSDISPKAGEYPRTMTATVNAYIHGVMADEIARLGTELKEQGFRRPLTLVHNTGGTKKSSRTRAILTHNAGPVAGLHGAALLAKFTGDRNVVFTDMGGTSFDIGLIEEGAIHAHDFIPVVDRWRTNIPAIEVKSIGAGGGSIAWVNELMGNTLEVGPRSAGSMPGPACYDQGGREPTVTDADLLLGLYNPENHLGGEIALDPELSRAAIEEHIAHPLGLDPLEAAWRIRRLVDAKMGHEVFNEVALKGHDPRQFAILACGGAGGAHACGYAVHAGARRILMPPQSAVFGAFGASSMPIREIWERSRSLQLFNWAQRRFLEDVSPFNMVVEEIRALALGDLKLEGYEEAQIELRLELEMRYGSQYKLTRVHWPTLFLRSSADSEALCEEFTRRYSEMYSPEATFASGGINIETFYMTATVVSTPLALEPHAPQGESPPEQARRGSRRVYWHPKSGWVETSMWDWAGLAPGNVLTGPALIESPHTTFVIEPGWRFALDAYRIGILEKT
jgi:N-methylhydantoinase A/acetophenone carboxylase